ncbi:MAG TPA: phosphoribosylpyrophosphate synthetase [Hyphomonas sp.]|jgi:ribose-phosphate pyrophosphokinase|uniref:ribose-phosphate pyrophosphokinase n=1 Tax=uncultured Hyphomonas sp. TaxID=225298 RepID=UPI000C4A3749|nr:phosphoribosylpyrophosphate synthetase [Hyphomonadaceae bacterium]HBL93813.1 phosphoribosylpyrophosphate synthetase [Hyphomonas sp.]HCJ18767.1 phosphoribosylpyrophosphate synthetase [Hyphomonas sp.]|tara:strand:- start:16811 stop:17671 length:861 start_codon:yes stop_codon:yes gene_type:complete
MTIYIPLPGNEAMASELASLTSSELGALELRRFPDEETYVRIASDVSGKAVELVCTLARPDPQLPGLLFAAYTARELGASSVGLIAPYLAYMRQDKRFSDGESVSSRHFARLLSGAFDRIVTVDPHLHRIHDLDEVFSINTKVVHAAPALADWIKAHVDKPLIIGPDSESEQWVSDVAERAGAPHLVLSKVRHGDRDVEVTAPGLENWAGHQPVLVDDIASSGRTMIEAAQHFETAGFPKPVCVVVHPLFADDAYTALRSMSSRVVSTNAISHPSADILITHLLVS